MKLLENKIQEQTKEISMRSKTIEELQYSLNLLIEKYNELKKKYDVVIIENKEKKCLTFSLQNNIFVKNFSLKILGEIKTINLKVLEDENIRIKHKLALKSEEFDKLLLNKNEEILKLQKELNQISSKYSLDLQIIDDKLKDTLKMNEHYLRENNEQKDITDKLTKKYHKYKSKYLKMQNEIIIIKPQNSKTTEVIYK